jgi:hypothetical protein
MFTLQLDYNSSVLVGATVFTLDLPLVHTRDKIRGKGIDSA